jgi:hypothetical protein
MVHLSEESRGGISLLAPMVADSMSMPTRTSAGGAAIS